MSARVLVDPDKLICASQYCGIVLDELRSENPKQGRVLDALTSAMRILEDAAGGQQVEASAPVGAPATGNACAAPHGHRETHFETEYQAPGEILDMRLYQANALSSLLYGEGLEAFQNMAGDLQDGVLWALSSLINDAKVAAGRPRQGGAA